MELEHNILVTVGVSCEPDVVLGKEELQTDSSEPGEEAGVAASNPARDVPEQNETDNLEKIR